MRIISDADREAAAAHLSQSAAPCKPAASGCNCFECPQDLEGNRRLATIRVLNNPAVLNDLEVRSAVKRRLKALSAQFDLDAIEPIDCFEVAERADGATWLNQRHTGENRGRGIVNWGGVATARFRGRDPALQALDFVLTHGGLSDAEKEIVDDHFPISTLDRLISTPAVRSKLGMEIADGKLIADLSLAEAIKPLRKIVLDLANEIINVTQLKSKEQQVAYVGKLAKDLPDLTKRTGKPKPIDELEQEAKPQPKPKPKPKPVRTTLIPRDCYLTVSNAKIAEIAKELRRLSLADYPHSISVLFRVFLETSVDHYLTATGIALHEMTKGGKRDKSLKTKVQETVNEMVSKNTPKKDLDGVAKGINDSKNPLFIDTLHNYVHNRFFSPAERDLTVAWDNAQLFFEKIWK